MDSFCYIIYESKAFPPGNKSHHCPLPRGQKQKQEIVVSFDQLSHCGECDEVFGVGVRPCWDTCFYQCPARRKMAHLVFQASNSPADRGSFLLLRIFQSLFSKSIRR